MFEEDDVKGEGEGEVRVLFSIGLACNSPVAVFELQGVTEPKGREGAGLILVILP